MLIFFFMMHTGKYMKSVIISPLRLLVMIQTLVLYFIPYHIVLLCVSCYYLFKILALGYYASLVMCEEHEAYFLNV